MATTLILFINFWGTLEARKEKLDGISRNSFVYEHRRGNFVMVLIDRIRMDMLSSDTDPVFRLRSRTTWRNSSQKSKPYFFFHNQRGNGFHTIWWVVTKNQQNSLHFQSTTLRNTYNKNTEARSGHSEHMRRSLHSSNLGGYVSTFFWRAKRPLVRGWMTTVTKQNRYLYREGVFDRIYPMASHRIESFGSLQRSIVVSIRCKSNRSFCDGLWRG